VYTGDTEPTGDLLRFSRKVTMLVHESYTAKAPIAGQSNAETCATRIIGHHPTRWRWFTSGREKVRIGDRLTEVRPGNSKPRPRDSKFALVTVLDNFVSMHSNYLLWDVYSILQKLPRMGIVFISMS